MSSHLHLFPKGPFGKGPWTVVYREGRSAAKFKFGRLEPSLKWAQMNPTTYHPILMSLWLAKLQLILGKTSIIIILSLSQAEFSFYNQNKTSDKMSDIIIEIMIESKMLWTRKIRWNYNFVLVLLDHQSSDWPKIREVCRKN